MPFSEEVFNDIQRKIRLALVSTKLSDWERSFLRDMQWKLERYGRRTSLSDKQYRQLMKLTREYAEPKLKNGNPSRKLSVGNNAWRRNRRRLWRSSLKSAIVIVGLIFVLLYKGAERFPEYLSPLVAATSSKKIVGPVTHVRDGDTIEVSGIPIRFGSLDCAETGTRAGERATLKMRSLISGQTLICYLNGRTSYDRKIGSCQLEDGRDLGAIMISEGYCGRFW